jgi:hypothetical protein
MNKLFLLAALMLTSAACSMGKCYDYYSWNDQPYPDQMKEHRYQIHPNVTTPTGMHVDTSGLPVDVVDLFDRQANEVDECVHTLAADGGFTKEQRRAFLCDDKPIKQSVCRDCFIIKVAPDASLSRDKSHEVLPAEGPVDGCIAKGQCLDENGAVQENCSCHWRGGFQSNEADFDLSIVVTPSAYLFKQYYLMSAYSCIDVWTMGCATPSVPPLSGLVTK